MYIFYQKLHFLLFSEKIELLMLLLSVDSYLFINFGGASGSGCTVLFIFNYQFYRPFPSKWQYILIIITWSSFRQYIIVI